MDDETEKTKARETDANADTQSAATHRSSLSSLFKSHQLHLPQNNKTPPAPLQNAPSQNSHSPKQPYPRRNWHPKDAEKHPKMPPTTLYWEKMKMKGISPILHYRPSGVERRWILPLSVASLAFLLLLLLFTTLSSPFAFLAFYPFAPTHIFVESKLRVAARVGPTAPFPPRLAYLISGSAGDGRMLRRTLQALYHPRNLYVVHLDLESPPEERKDLLEYVAGHSLFEKVGNVRMITRANLVTYRGPTMVANTLHAAAILLREGGEWDWFINLSASDYPLVTQDDLLHTFSHLRRDLNFIDHTSDIGWKEFQRAKPVIIDPGLYTLKKADVFWITQRRSVPTAFKLFTGSAWMALSRSFIDYCIWGWSNLPRTVLMYYSNFLSSPEGYFHTVVCNAKEFINTTVNHDLHFISWDNPPKQHPHHLTISDFSSMVESNAPFARKFRADDPVLDKIDAELLSRSPDMLVPGGWCIGPKKNNTDPCSVVGNTTALRPGPGAKRLESLINSLLSVDQFHPRQCK